MLQLKEDTELRMELSVGRRALGLISDIWCVQLTTIGPTSKQITGIVHQVLQLPITTVTNIGCKGHVIISDTEVEVLKLFRNFKPISENRFVILVLNTLKLIFEHTHVFGDADVTLVCVNKTYHLVTSRISRYFQEITSEGDNFAAKATSLPDFMGRTLQVGTFSCPPFSYGTARNMSPLAEEDADEGELSRILTFKYNQIMSMNNELILNYLSFLFSNLIAVSFLPIFMLLVLSVRSLRSFSILPTFMLLLLSARNLKTVSVLPICLLILLTIRNLIAD